MTPQEAAAYDGYMQANPDLVDFYNTNVASTGMSMEDFAANHWRDSGQKEGRNFPGGAPAGETGGPGPSGPGLQPPGGGPVQGGLAPGNTGLNGLLDADTLAALKARLIAGGGNTSQTQGGAQTGDFSSATNQSQNQQTQSQTNSTTKKSGTSDTTGSTDVTHTVIDNLGLGDLIKGQTAGVGAADDQRRAWLLDTMSTGGSGFNSQVDEAVRNSLTGAQVTGAGDSARARASGYAASDVARKNLDERLVASSQLAGPTGSGSLVQQAAPLFGSHDVGTSNSHTVDNSTENTIGNNISNMTGNMSGTTSGSASGSSLGSGSGQTPLQQQQSGGGCFVCSALASKGIVSVDDVTDAVKYKLYSAKSRNMPIGYALYGPWLARMTLQHLWVQRLIQPCATRILREELRLAGRGLGFDPLAWALHAIWHNCSGLLGLIARKFGAKFETKDESVRELLIKNNLYFSI